MRRTLTHRKRLAFGRMASASVLSIFRFSAGMVLPVANVVKAFGDLHFPKLLTSFATLKIYLDKALA